MRKLWALLLLFSVLISSVAFVPGTVHAQTEKWTFMVYMGGDSSLESFGIDDFIEMASVGSTPDVNIVVQFDRTSSYSSQYDDWTTAKRYLVQKDMRPTIASALEDLGEVNMGDPQTLVDFAVWAIENYTADRYFLNLWGHGRGWKGVVQDLSSGSDYLELDELKWAFEAIRANNSGKKIDLVGADACRMTIEMNYQLKDYVDFFVGSQKDEPEPGWPYDTILNDLTNDSDMGPAGLGRVIVDRYIESYVDNTGLSVALSVIDSSQLENLGEEVRRFVEQARSALPLYVEAFKSARLVTEHYEGDSVYDMRNLFENIHFELPGMPLIVGEPGSPTPQRLVDVLVSSGEAVYLAVSYEDHWDNVVSSVRTTFAHGASIWYPLGVFDITYFDLDFSKATGWGDYLVDFEEAVSGTPGTEVVLDVDKTLLDADGNGFDDTVQLELLSPVNATLEIDIRYHLSGWREPSIPIFLPEGVVRLTNITLSQKSNIDLELYLLNETGVWLNFTCLRNALGVWYHVSGFIMDGTGNPLSGATITLENLNNGETDVNESISSGSYSVILKLADAWDETTYTLQLTVEYGDEVINTTFSVVYPYEKDTKNFVMGPGDHIESDDTILWILVILLVIEAIFVIVLVLLLRGRGKEPDEKSGEELLKELKVD
ncbi:MAG: hypothetical protein JSV43_03565 [Methanobacteriota archaeon]|nr:MAG: hypothetical protein JSV43_03565 [Euryarchaeota archaeon]